MWTLFILFSTLNNFLIWSPGINMIVSTPTKSTILRRTVFKWIFYLLRSPRYGYRKITIIQRNTVISKNAIERKLFMIEPQKQRQSIGNPRFTGGRWNQNFSISSPLDGIVMESFRNISIYRQKLIFKLAKNIWRSWPTWNVMTSTPSKSGSANPLPLFLGLYHE